MATKSSKPLRILVPLDGSSLAEQAISFAMSAGGQDSTIELMTVIEPSLSHSDERGWRYPVTEQGQERMANEATQRLQSVADRWHLGKRLIALRALQGDIAERIVDEAKDQRFGLIVMSSHGRGAAGRWRFGSVADRVTRASETPVMIVRPFDAGIEIGPAKVNRFVVPLDGSALARMAIPVAIRLALHARRPVHLVEVMRASNDLFLAVEEWGVLAPRHEYHEQIQEREDQVAVTLAEHAHRFESAGVPVSWSLQHGDVIDNLRAAMMPDDVAVMASHGQSGIRRWALGSVVEKLIRHGDAPVIVVRAHQQETTAD